MKRKIGLVFTALLLIFSGCSLSNEVTIHGTENPDAEEILTSNPHADIFQYNDTVYKTHIDWVDELSVTKDEQVGEITVQNESDTNFENGMANKLQVGTKIFSVKERDDILIVETDGELLKYLAIVEG